MSTPKPFQQATVEAAVRTLVDCRRSVRRFLVADEVGLGKTVVAQQVLKHLMEKRTPLSKPLTVFYVCSNLAIANQNRDKLLQVLPDEERKNAQCNVDRLTLMPTAQLPTHPELHLFTLTPDTSVPVRHHRRRDGRKEERALLQVLVEVTFPGLIEAMGWDTSFFMRQATAHWGELVAKRRLLVAQSGMHKQFKRAVREAFGLEPRERLHTRLRAIEDDLEIIATLRTALALQALQKLDADLVIFDEFQRFRDLIDEEQDESASRIVKVLRGDGGSALLMLSATPYSLLTPREQDGSASSHHEQLLDLVDFLYGRGEIGKQKMAACRKAFSTLERALRRRDAEDGQAQLAVSDLEAVLRPVMARTERAQHPLGCDTAIITRSLASPLMRGDLLAYRAFAASLHKLDTPAAPAYWSSIPMPLQTMGSRYQAWKRADTSCARAHPALTAADRNRFALANSWPHPKLRTLAMLATPRMLSLPWVAPSRPWWSLKGPWQHAEARNGKILVFSRFRAVPAAVSAALSYDLERSCPRNSKLVYSEVPKRRMLQATGERMPLLAAFHPCTLLAQAVDPIRDSIGSAKEARDSVRRQLKQWLQEHNVAVVKEQQGRSRPVWKLLAGIERQLGVFDDTLRTWRALQARIGHQTADRDTQDREDGVDSGLARLIERWDSETAAKPLETITQAELDGLVQHVLGAPGMVLARAVQRHWLDATSSRQLAVLLDASWTGLRSYLDQRWFASTLGQSELNYLDALIQAAIDGNLESVLDEWFWLLQTLHGLTGPQLCEEIMAVGRLRGSDVRLHEPDDKEASFSLRAHAALPFVEARQGQEGDEGGEARPLRNDELRRAFNSPFHPHVLSTTSVGQEGLDFHAWCRTIVHWDLAPNAADLEQREGRIQRFAGLSVRREIARLIPPGAEAVAGKTDQASPWFRLARCAEDRLGDDSGMAPWWVCEGAHIDRFVLDVPTSQQRARLEALQVQRGLYRAVLGQPYQEDLIAAMRRRGWDTSQLPGWLQPMLSPYFQRQSRKENNDDDAGEAAMA